MKNKTKIVLITIAISVILLSFIGGQAYAKYMSKVTGNGAAEIASWKFKVNENEETMQSISLNSTINNITLANRKVAPGTSGEFQIKLDATDADVGIYYTINFINESTKPKNLKFTYNGEVYDTLESMKNNIIGTIHANAQNKQEIITIGWEWPYETGTTDVEKENNNNMDTRDAQLIRDYTFDVVVTGTQVKPQ